MSHGPRVAAAAEPAGLTIRGATDAVAATQSITLDVQNFTLMNKNLRGTVFGSCNPNADIALLSRLYRAGRLKLDEMVTRRYRLDDANEAYADLLNGELIRGGIDFGVT
jgi:alcohol dehydrogenase